MNNTPKTVAEILTRLENAVAYDVTKRVLNHQSGRSPKSSHLEAITALNELRKADMAYVIGEDETYEGHQMVWSIEHRNTLRAEARLRAEERLQK